MSLTVVCILAYFAVGLVAFLISLNHSNDPMTPFLSFYVWPLVLGWIIIRRKR